MKRLENKIAVVTGAGSGIGKATAMKFAESGAKVGLIDIKEENAKKIKEEIESLGGEAIVLEADTANPEQMKKSVAAIGDKWGKIDIVFANAGINGTLSSIEAFDPDDWDETITTNLKGTFLTVKYSIPHMKEQGGSIIITSSVNGNRTFSNIGFSAYSSSKAGQMAFGKMAALELSTYKIRVNVICPGAIDTNIDKNTFPEEDTLKEVQIPVEFPEGSHPLENRPGKAEQVADLVHFLASDESSHISGTEIYIDGAETLLR